LVAPHTTVPTILGPASCSRVDAPPTFQVDPSPHAYYVVEVATKPELFDGNGHGAERTSNNFYGSWSDTSFQTSAAYTLPAAVWARVRLADRLWYRVGSSASGSSYVDYVVSTDDDQGASARSIEILSGIGPPPPSTESKRSTISELSGMPRDTGQPWIEGPVRWDRSNGPPTFRLELSGDAACRVELSVDPGAYGWLASEWIAAEQTAGAPALGFRGYTVPLETWERLLHAERLSYRLTVAGEDPASAHVFSTELVGIVESAKDGVAPIRSSELLWRQVAVHETAGSSSGLTVNVRLLPT
jgi:hypothetical protein